MNMTVVVSRVVDPGPPAVIHQRAVSVPVPEGASRTELAQVLHRAPAHSDVTVDVLT